MDDTDPLDTIESILTARSTHHKTGELMPQFILTAWDAHQILDAINETRQRISSLSLSLTHYICKGEITKISEIMWSSRAVQRL